MAPSFEDGNSVFEFVVRRGNGVKGLVDSGLSKVPEAYVQPPKERIDKEKAVKHGLPPIDLSKLDGFGPDHDEVVDQIVKAAETLGFFQVVNHGVPLHLLESLKDTAHYFFSLSPQRKAVYRSDVSPSPLVKYGTSFMPEKEKALEWKDYILMQYTNDDEALQHWPQEIKGVLLEYLRSSIGMVKKLLQVLLGNFGIKPDDPMIDVLIGKKMLILLQDGIGGLYVKMEQDIDYGKKGDWIEIPPTPNALVINVGDMLQILSNGKYKSAEHRVHTTSTSSRVSIPIFTMPRETTKIVPLPQVVEKDGTALYREFVLIDYMKNFFGNAHEGKKSLDFAQINPT
ncbi:hypothetical protein Godav_029936 [Gossypium davidsonii]|uniref:Fe2OG dioxygenase domain-containing protein n=2 Tax=Gossypium TaxID=3633 RepID=A0A7J8TG97_GOSDV|nr:hypothetical protein [Gossypium davidsonii]MBA0672729.1 hypothetical protein [Gossypium klotzschianum]